jgi:hypothetical protein
MRLLNFSFYLILPAILGPGVYLACNRNEYQKQRKSKKEEEEEEEAAPGE